MAALPAQLPGGQSPRRNPGRLLQPLGRFAGERGPEHATLPGTAFPSLPRRRQHRALAGACETHHSRDLRRPADMPHRLALLV